MTFQDLNLPESFGHGLWTQTVTIDNDDWGAAETDLVQQAQTWIGEHPDRATGYHVNRNEKSMTLTLDLMRGA